MTMSVDDRNFRSIYYGKVGFKGIEEKKSIEIIMKEEPIDYIKISQFCLKFPVPSAYRYFIWQVVLGVLPCHQSVHLRAVEQRKRQYVQLNNALVVMRKIDQETPLEILFLKMYLIEEKALPLHDDDSKLIDENMNFVKVAKVIIELVNDNVQAFWLAVKFVVLLEKSATYSRQTIQSEIEQILGREDSELLQNVRSHMLLDAIPFQTLFASAFASLFPDDVVERIWDRLIGGSTAYLYYLFVAVLLVMKRQIMSSCNFNQMLDNISAHHSELALSMATDLWLKDGCPLVL